MAWYDDPIIVTVVIVVVIAAIGVVVFAMRRAEKKPPEPKKKPEVAIDLSVPSSLTSNPFKVSKSVQTSMAYSAKDELRTLGLEQEILGDAIRRLYEACAENRISQEERDRLASYYTVRMSTIKQSIAKDENIVALHELESMQEDLMKLFSERFGELSSKVEALRTQIDVKPIREVTIKTPAQLEKNEPEEELESSSQSSEDKQKRRSPKKSAEEKPEKPEGKNEGDRRVESITLEVEKILDRLGQMENEA